jgi:hypothetical protein
MEITMGFYRCYSIDEAGDALDFSNFVAATDAEAIDWAERFQVRQGCPAIELWEEGRRIPIERST